MSILLKNRQLYLNFIIYNVMLKAIKVRIYPNLEQENLLNKLFGCYRFTYNKMFDIKEHMYEHDLKLNRNDLQKLFHSDILPNYSFLQEFNSNILKGSLLVLDNAYKNFFNKKSGFPKFKNKYSDQSVIFYKNSTISKFNLEDGKFNLTKNIKGLKFRTSERDEKYLLKYKKQIKNITISKSITNKYFASILIDSDEPVKILKQPINYIQGFDLGIKTFIVGSKGISFENLKSIRSNEKQLKKLHRKLSKKVKGSNNREKVRLKLAILNEKIHNKKLNYINEISSKIVNENQIIVLENLNVSGMLKNHKLAKSIQELSLSEFKIQIEYKSLFYGREVIKIDRFFPSSKKCSCCGNIKKDLKLSDRTYICSECGLIIDRDLNASINIENEGLIIYNEKIGKCQPEFKLVEKPPMESDILISDSCVSLNQELLKINIKI
jgi:putative transposase